MSDEQERQHEQVQVAQSEQAQNKWGDPISEARQRELDNALQRWEQLSAAEREPRRGPFDRKGWTGSLTGTDVFYLAARVVAGGLTADAVALADAQARLLDERRFSLDLVGLHLEGASLRGAHLEGSDFNAAHLEGATLVEAHLEGAFLRGAGFNEESDLEYVSLDDTPNLPEHLLARVLRRKVWGPAALGDVRWHDVDLTPVFRWPRTRLGDERGVAFIDRGGADHRDAARAYRQVAQRLRDQGMADEADRFSYRAQSVQRAVALRQGQLGRWLFSWVLYVLAGYGYRPLRAVLWYLTVIAGFAIAYFRVTHGLPVFFLSPSQLGKKFEWLQAFVLSFSAFHGRGFFNPPAANDLGDSVAILATAEAVFGLFIEISFIATFTQRFFGAK
jgi:Pentapeptide repeats (8 copies)